MVILVIVVLRLLLVLFILPLEVNSIGKIKPAAGMMTRGPSPHTRPRSIATE